jgi:DUF1707 SHOCT-like domain
MSAQPPAGDAAAGDAAAPPAPRAGLSIRASDADRDHVVDLLRDQYTEGRLTLEEFTSRVATASAARTWGELRAQLSDLPVNPGFGGAGPGQVAAVPAQTPDAGLVLLVVLLVVCPPAGLAYWYFCYRQSQRVVTRAAGPGERS